MINVQPSSINLDNGGSVAWTEEGIRSMLKKIKLNYLPELETLLQECIWLKTKLGLDNKTMESLQESERRLIRFASLTEEVIAQIKGYDDLTKSTLIDDDKDALMTLENKITQAILPIRAKLMSKLVPLANLSRATTGQGIVGVGVGGVVTSSVVSLPDLPAKTTATTTRNVNDGHDSDTTTSTTMTLDLAHHRKTSCPSPSSVLGHGAVGASSTVMMTSTTTVSPISTATEVTAESLPVFSAPPVFASSSSSSSSFMATTAVKQEGYHSYVDQGQGQGQGLYSSSLSGKKRRSDADLVALVLELTDSTDDCGELLPSPGLDMGDPSLFPSPTHHTLSHSTSTNSLCGYMDIFDHAEPEGCIIDPNPPMLPVSQPLSSMFCFPSAPSASSSSSSSSSMAGGMPCMSTTSSSMPRHHVNTTTTTNNKGIDLGHGGGSSGQGGEYMSSRRRRRLNLIVPNPRKPRTAEYTCSLCSEDYQVYVGENPWWAVYTHECPKCKQSQIPRIDISASNNAIELDPNVIALYGEGVEDSCDDGDDDDSEGEEEDVGGAGGGGGDNEGGGVNPSDLDQEDLKRDVHPFDGEGLLAAEEASKLLVLMCHARSCTGAHASPKHAEICKSTKFLMLHIRDCNGVDVRGRGDCQFPWCQPCKRMLRHLTHCYDPANCVICNPWTLPESFQQLRSLNNRSLAIQQQAKAAAAAAASAAAAQQHQPPMTMMMSSGAGDPMSVDNLVMPPEW